MLGGGSSAVTGYLLLFPFYGTGISGMQLAEIVHATVGMLFIAAMLGHIYIGTIGMEGAFEAMGEGTVDVNWAKQHHSLWLKDEMSRAPRAPAPGPSPPNRRPISQLQDARLQGRAFCYKGPCASSVSPAGAVPAKPR